MRESLSSRRDEKREKRRKVRGNVVARRQESQERNRWVLHVPNAPKTTAPVIPTSFALPPPSLQLATGTGRGSSSAEAFASAGALAVPGLAALRVRGEGAVESGEFGGVRPWIIFAEGRRAPRNFLAAGGVGTARCDGGGGGSSTRQRPLVWVACYRRQPRPLAPHQKHNGLCPSL